MDETPGRPAVALAVGVVAMALVVSALAVVLAVVSNRDTRPRAGVGDVFDHPFQENPLPHLGEVLLPWSRTRVGAGRPQAELPDLLGSEPTVQAPYGGSFVRVEVDLVEDGGIPLATVGVPYVQQTDVVLRADGRDYDLSVPGGLEIDPNKPAGQDASRWIAVAGRPTDLEVRVTVDGITQVVDATDGSVEAGRAGDLEPDATRPAPADTPATPCGEPRRLDSSGLRVSYRPALDCQVNLTLHTSYVDGLGWAEPGREYVVVQVVRPRNLSLTSGRGRARKYWDDELTSSARLGDVAPVGAPLDVNSFATGTLGLQDPDDPEQVVFDVPRDEPVGDLVLDVVADARLGEPFVTERRQARFEWTVPAGALA